MWMLLVHKTVHKTFKLKWAKGASASNTLITNKNSQKQIYSKSKTTLTINRLIIYVASVDFNVLFVQTLRQQEQQKQQLQHQQQQEQQLSFILLWSVLQILTFLMNDIRLNSLYKAKKSSTTTTKILNCNKHKKKNNTNLKKTIILIKKKLLNKKPLTLSSIYTTIACSVIISTSSIIKNFTLFSNKNNNPRTYNNSSKSNKVFLHYIPRDPRLRIRDIVLDFNKHFGRSQSELNITEDLCNYGELIGGKSVCETSIKLCNQLTSYQYQTEKKETKKNRLSDKLTIGNIIEKVNHLVVSIVVDIFGTLKAITLSSNTRKFTIGCNFVSVTIAV